MKRQKQSSWIRRIIRWEKYSTEPNWPKLPICVKCIMFSAFRMKYMNGWSTTTTNMFAFVSFVKWREMVRFSPNTDSIGTLPDMWERTITIGSAGKTFSVTGWKTGWAYGPANLLFNLQMVHQNSLYTCATPIQVIKQLIYLHPMHRCHLLFKFLCTTGSGRDIIRSRTNEIGCQRMLF